MEVGIVALQGAFTEHAKILSRLHVKSFEIRNLSDLNKPMDGIILPGGESTAISKLLHELNMFDKLRKLIEEGLPTFGTCAGLVLLAKNIKNEPAHFSLLDVEVVRNGYGRQLGSFYTESTFANFSNIPMTFIRAPYIQKVGKNVEILSEIDNKIVACRQQNILVTSFHPELNSDLTIHNYFMSMM